MVDALRQWITNICVTVFFITAVELILPNNSLKKYGKFVLGLILISVLINPIMKVVNKNFDFNTYSQKAMEYIDGQGYQNNYVNYKEKNINATLSTFKLNLEDTIDKKLKEEFPNQTFKVEANIEYDNDSENFTIRQIQIGVKNGGIERIKKVDINADNSTNDNQNQTVSEIDGSIKSFLNKELDLDENIIKTYKL